MKKAIIITGPGFEDSEVIYPYYRLIEAGVSVKIATKDKKAVKGKHGVMMNADVDAKQLQEKDYDIVLIPGGHEAPDRVRQIEEVLTFLKEMNEAGKIIASICHGPWVLISANLLKGKKATCYAGMKDDLINAGATYVNDPVVVDGNLITSQHPDTLPDWMKTIVEICAQ